MTKKAQVAKTIKTELKAIFPDLKISVKSEAFAGGDAVRIDLNTTDNDTLKKVREITRKYQSYRGEYEGYVYSKDIQQVDFVTVTAGY